MSVEEALKLAQTIELEKQRAREEAKREMEEELRKQKETAPQTGTYARGASLSHVEVIPGSEKYQPSRQQHPNVSPHPTVQYPQSSSSKNRGVIILSVIAGIIIIGVIFSFLNKSNDREEHKTVAQAEVVSQPQQTVSPSKSTSSTTAKKTSQSKTQTSTKATTPKANPQTTAKQTSSSQTASETRVVETPKSIPVKSTPAISPFEEAKTKADAGDAASCYKVAMAYRDGDGVGKSLPSAFSYMKKAADNGYTPAYIEVAKMYHGGRGVTKDRDVAEKWYKKAADAGNSEAKRILLNM